MEPFQTAIHIISLCAKAKLCNLNLIVTLFSNKNFKIKISIFTSSFELLEVDNLFISILRNTSQIIKSRWVQAPKSECRNIFSYRVTVPYTDRVPYFFICTAKCFLFGFTLQIWHLSLLFDTQSPLANQTKTTTEP